MSAWTGPGVPLEVEQVVSILTEVGLRAPDTVGDRLDSLELARLIYEVEHRYGLHLDLTDEELERMSTVSGAAEVIRLARAEVGAGPVPAPAMAVGPGFQVRAEDTGRPAAGSLAGPDGTGKEATP